VILIQTRWHEDDLAGRIIAEMERGGEPWEIVSLPAEAEAGDLLGRKPGQWLWDDAYGYGGFLRHEKATQLPRNWSALYQQQENRDFSGPTEIVRWPHPIVIRVTIRSESTMMPMAAIHEPATRAAISKAWPRK
jgi:hypothetical protein